MPTPSIAVAGRSLSNLGVRTTTVKGPWDVPQITDPTVAIPGRGDVRIAGARQIATRFIDIEGTVREWSGTRSNADTLLKLDRIKTLLLRGSVEVTLINRPTRVYATTLETFTVVWDGPDLAADTCQLTVRLKTETLAYELEPQLIGFGATPVQIPTGTAAHGGIVVVSGPATNPQLIIRGITGLPVHTIQLTASLADTDYERIDLDAMTLTRYLSAATGAADPDAHTGGDLEDFLFSPNDGDPDAGVYATIECTGLGTDGGAELLYWAAHL
jgi:hypothetical protein